jgi:hypothetical protein
LGGQKYFNGWQQSACSKKNVDLRPSWSLAGDGVPKLELGNEVIDGVLAVSGEKDTIMPT